MQFVNITKKFLDTLTYEVIGAAIEVHKELGPGLLESIYHECMKYELTERHLKFKSELTIPVSYKEIELRANLRCDFLVENCLVVELKAAQAVQPIHEAVLISYLKLLESPKGIIINFNVLNIFKEGQKTYVNDLYRNLN